MEIGGILFHSMGREGENMQRKEETKIEQERKRVCETEQEREVKDFLEQIGKSGSILGLDSMRELMRTLGDVQDQLKVIHVAGTNGKGSVCAMLSSVLQEAGCRVGTYTSPAVFDRMEQYQVNGRPISSQRFAEVMLEVRKGCLSMEEQGKDMPTLFEVETAAAFLYFYQESCQVVVLETGMGGETDATNIIRKPLVSVLTSISIDHRNFLGDTLEEIARVKAGIIKESGQVVAAKPEQRQIQEILEQVCKKQKAELTYGEKDRAEHLRREGEYLCFSYEGFGEIRLSMTGAYQVENSICVLETLKILKAMGWEISSQAVREGLRGACWEGRFSLVCRDPLFWIDGAHNEDGAKKLLETLEMGFTNEKIIYIIGVLADKEYEKILKLLLPKAQKVFTVTPDHPRGLEGRLLAKEAEKYHQNVTYCETVEEAVSLAVADGKEEGAVILAFGSLSYLGEVKKITEKITRRNRSW